MKKIKTIGIISFILILVALTWSLMDRISYSKELPLYSIKEDNDTTLTIGIIGDSWVAEKKLDSLIQFGLLENNIKSRIFSSGQGGAVSKLIYQNLFKENGKPYSTKFIIETNPDYCIVIAGVNDASGQIGAGFYTYHIKQITKTLLHYKITPVIVTLPEFGIEETPENMNIVTGNIWKYRNLVFSYFNNNGEINNINTYRESLATAFEAEKLKDSVIFINFDNLCKDYHNYPELYSDRGHLSKFGNEMLGNVIVNELYSTIDPQLLHKLKK